MKSRDILGGFFADASFSEICSPEKFARDCAGSIDSETALLLYNLISEQHGNSVEKVLRNVREGGYVPETHELAKSALEAGEDAVQLDPTSHNTSPLFLIECLEKAIKSGETQETILDEQIQRQLKQVESGKVRFSTLVEQFLAPGNSPDEALCVNAVNSAEKCVAVLHKAENSEIAENS